MLSLRSRNTLGFHEVLSVMCESAMLSSQLVLNISNVTFNHLVPQSMLPAEDMLDSEAQRRRGSNKWGDGETTPSSTTKPFTIPEGEKKHCCHLNN